MKKPFLTCAAIMGVLAPASSFAETSGNWLPESGVKSPYSPLAVPTTLKPLRDSLTRLLDKGYQITTMASYTASGEMFTLVHRDRTVLCVLTPPVPGTDQTVPTSRCWALNQNN